MKKIYTLFLIANVLQANGQKTEILPNFRNVVTTPAKESRIVFRCRATNIDPDPLLVIDGVPYEYSHFQKINPNNIESVTVLKDAAASVLYGYRASNGAIIITTKSSKLRKFIIKDFLDGKTIPGATVKFKSVKDRNDSLVTAANDSGFVLTNKLKPGADYEIEASSIGFKNYTLPFKNTASYYEQSVFMERNTNNLSEVVIVTPHTIRCFRCGTMCRVGRCYYTVEDTVKEKAGLKIYPNPLPRGSNINIELRSEVLPGSSIRVFSLSGALMYQEKISTAKWKNLSIASHRRWTAGTYIVQLLNEAGKLTGKQKIIIQ